MTYGLYSGGASLGDEAEGRCRSIAAGGEGADQRSRDGNNNGLRA